MGGRMGRSTVNVVETARGIEVGADLRGVDCNQTQGREVAEDSIPEKISNTPYHDNLSQELINSERRCAELREQIAQYYKNPRAYEDMFRIQMRGYL